VKLDGWAIESRIYAEDPYRNFLPSTGRLTRYNPPAEGNATTAPFVRNDTGVFEGGEISTFYDPMIAKLCTWAPDPPRRHRRHGRGAGRVRGRGRRQQLPFLSAVMAQARFRDGRLTTGYIAEEFPGRFQRRSAGRGIEGTSPPRLLLGLRLRTRAPQRTPSPARRRSPPRRADRRSPLGLLATYRADGIEYWLTDGDGKKHLVESGWKPGMSLCIGRVDGELHHVKVDRVTGGFRLRWRGADLIARVRCPRRRPDAA
jgi:propionyl-CoA carboxylase alpha chain